MTKAYSSRFLASCAVALGLLGAQALGCSSGTSATDSGADSDGSDSDGSDSGTGSGGKSSGTGGGSSSTTGGSSSTSGGSSSSSSSSSSVCGLADRLGNLGGDGPTDSGIEGCAASSVRAEVLPADIFLMIDQSYSMGDNHVIRGDDTSPTRWEVMSEALKGFITSPDSAGLHVGVQYFGLPEPGASVSCNSDVYATADVEIGELPDNESALVDSIDAHYPSNQTPSVPALEGALRHAKAWTENHPERPTVVVFATDGYPTECVGDADPITELEDLARAYANPTDGSPRVPTFVVGVGQVSNLKRVATAGGSGAPFFLGDCDTAIEDLEAALHRIASSPSVCEYELPAAPEGEILDFDQVNLTFTSETGNRSTVPHVDDLEHCVAGGWYYDDPVEPTKVIVCPSTCSSFIGGRVDVVVGCETISIH